LKKNENKRTKKLLREKKILTNTKANNWHAQKYGMFGCKESYAMFGSLEGEESRGEPFPFTLFGYF